jgi:hypothetical protein
MSQENVMAARKTRTTSALNDFARLLVGLFAEAASDFEFQGFDRSPILTQMDRLSGHARYDELFTTSHVRRLHAE